MHGVRTPPPPILGVEEVVMLRLGWLSALGWRQPDTSEGLSR